MSDLLFFAEEGTSDGVEKTGELGLVIGVPGSAGGKIGSAGGVTGSAGGLLFINIGILHIQLESVYDYFLLLSNIHPSLNC